MTPAWTSGTTAVGYDTNTDAASRWPTGISMRPPARTAADITGNGHDGTCSNNPVWSGTSSGGLAFNGINQTVYAPIDVSENSYDRFALVQNNDNRLRHVSGGRRQPGKQRLRSTFLFDRRKYGGPALERRNDRHHRHEFRRRAVASSRLRIRRQRGRATDSTSTASCGRPAPKIIPTSIGKLRWSLVMPAIPRTSSSRLDR